ncbi:hypothetical protein KL86DYS1_11429 [uncultured Dysgonomonas sp.]|uniref:Uncharacterized protein n=1 Tax=uncultured Dysgonomonas sp. TaxID=206096 RepID=A0A212J841_9BACT|nr:hypothetical protein KL86DYS1_11429 [uncultured Dysgonomonas sp.]
MYYIVTLLMPNLSPNDKIIQVFCTLKTSGYLCPHNFKNKENEKFSRDIKNKLRSICKRCRVTNRKRK